MRPASCPCSAATVQCSIRIASPSARGCGHDTMSPAPRMSGSPTAVSVASHSSPGFSCRPLPASHSVFGSAPSPTTTRSAATREPSVSSTASTRAGAVQRGDARSEAQIDAVVAVQRGAPLAQLRAERQHRRRGDVDQRHVEALLAGGLGDLAADESRAHDRDARALLERGSQRERRRRGCAGRGRPPARRRRPASVAPWSRSPGSAGRRRPRRRRRAPPAAARGPGSSPARPRRHCASSVSHGRWTLLDLVLAGKQLLRQRRARVRQVGLLAHHHQIAVEPCGSRSLRRPQPGERCPDDDDAAQLVGSLQVDKLKSVLKSEAQALPLSSVLGDDRRPRSLTHDR